MLLARSRSKYKAARTVRTEKVNKMFMVATTTRTSTEPAQPTTSQKQQHMISHMLVARTRVKIIPQLAPLSNQDGPIRTDTSTNNRCCLPSSADAFSLSSAGSRWDKLCSMAVGAADKRATATPRAQTHTHTHKQHKHVQHLTRGRAPVHAYAWYSREQDDGGCDCPAAHEWPLPH